MQWAAIWTHRKQLGAKKMVGRRMLYLRVTQHPPSHLAREQRMASASGER